MTLSLKGSSLWYSSLYTVDDKLYSSAQICLFSTIVLVFSQNPKQNGWKQRNLTNEIAVEMKGWLCWHLSLLPPSAVDILLHHCFASWYNVHFSSKSVHSPSYSFLGFLRPPQRFCFFLCCIVFLLDSIHGLSFLFFFFFEVIVSSIQPFATMQSRVNTLRLDVSLSASNLQDSIRSRLI